MNNFSGNAVSVNLHMKNIQTRTCALRLDSRVVWMLSLRSVSDTECAVIMICINTINTYVPRKLPVSSYLF